MILNFTKMNGLGNDFIVLEADDKHLLASLTLAANTDFIASTMESFGLFVLFI